MITDRFARFAVETERRDIADTAREMLLLSLLDWAAVGIAGTGEPVARILRAQAMDEAGTEQAHVFGHARAFPVRMAAMVNGTTSHALDYDDTHFDHIGHPSVAILPAALAMGEHLGASGEAFQDAALIGAELSIRIGTWLGRAHYQGGFHQTATAGTFGAAAAAGRLAGLDRAQMGAALGLAATRASGLKSQFGTMGKPFHAGLAAANGVEAVQLIMHHFKPNPQALESDQGFAATHMGENNVAALEDLGSDWRFSRISHKFHACCHGLHATLEALRQVAGIDPKRIADITITTHPRWLSVCNIAAPQTGLEAKFSYRMVTAMALLGHDTARLESYSDALCQNPDITALRERVSVTTSEALTETQSQVTLRLTDGTLRELAHDLDAPLPIDERRQRLRAKAAALLGEDREDRLWTMIAGNAAPGDLAREIAS